jgi:hypothetical protein
MHSSKRAPSGSTPVTGVTPDGQVLAKVSSRRGESVEEGFSGEVGLSKQAVVLSMAPTRRRNRLTGGLSSATDGADGDMVLILESNDPRTDCCGLL